LECASPLALCKQAKRPRQDFLMTFLRANDNMNCYMQHLHLIMKVACCARAETAPENR
jgi:hypothetical protein